MSLRLQRLLTCELAVCALLLKAAVPLLAATAAQLHGLPVAQVCSLYGVATLSTSSAGHSGHVHHHAAARESHDGAPHSAVEHGHDHCVLTAVALMAAGQAPPVLQTPGDDARSHRVDCAVACVIADDCARWIARLAHGPPASA